MSVVLCQAKDDHPHEDDHHYLEPDQVAPEPSMESLREIQPDTTGKATLIILKGEGTKEIESEPVLRVQSSLVHGTISSSKDHGIFGDGAMGSYPEPITREPNYPLASRVHMSTTPAHKGGFRSIYANIFYWIFVIFSSSN